MICQSEQLLNQQVDLVEEGSLLPFAQETANNNKSCYMREIVKDKGRVDARFRFWDSENMSKKRQKLQEWVSCALEVWLVTK